MLLGYPHYSSIESDKDGISYASSSNIFAVMTYIRKDCPFTLTTFVSLSGSVSNIPYFFKVEATKCGSSPSQKISLKPRETHTNADLPLHHRDSPTDQVPGGADLRSAYLPLSIPSFLKTAFAVTLD
jgi:hypothetical protein